MDSIAKARAPASRKIGSSRRASKKALARANGITTRHTCRRDQRRRSRSRKSRTGATVSRAKTMMYRLVKAANPIMRAAPSAAIVLVWVIATNSNSTASGIGAR